MPANFCFAARCGTGSFASLRFDRVLVEGGPRNAKCQEVMKGSQGPTDHQREFAASQMAGNVADERRLFGIGVSGAHEFMEHVAFVPEHPGNLSLQILVAPGSELLCVVQYRADDLPARPRIAP